ncbi:MAG: hypothetical protein IT193_13315, partial [Propionibacteriaceae bacterium]|nr:hypothetical protein [Propionibacteriaceae bacterium]
MSGAEGVSGPDGAEPAVPDRSIIDRRGEQAAPRTLLDIFRATATR